jgi:hypothetical protein
MSKRRGKQAKRSATATASASKRPAVKSIKQAAKRPAIKKSATAHNAKAAPKTVASSSPIERVTRVAKELGQQATSAVTEGVETLKEIGGTIVERVTG